MTGLRSFAPNDDDVAARRTVAGPDSTPPLEFRLLGSPPRCEKPLFARPLGEVVFVTDTKVCTKARDAYTAAIRRTDGVQHSGRVYVITVGTTYVVNDPVQVAGEFPIRMTLSNSYKILAKYS